MEMERSGCSLTVLFPFICFFFVCIFFIYPCLFLSPSFYFFSVSLTLLPPPSSVSTVFFLFSVCCMLLLSLAWNGDWKPPKVWRNCKSQKQPAQQPCKSTRNFLLKRTWKKQNKTKKQEKAEPLGSVFHLFSAKLNTLPSASFTYPLHCPTDTHNCLN